jgi:hypothetical protein
MFDLRQLSRLVVGEKSYSGGLHDDFLGFLRGLGVRSEG